MGLFQLFGMVTAITTRVTTVTRYRNCSTPVVVVERRGGGGGGMGQALVDVAEWRRGGVVVASFHVAIVS